MNIAIIGSGGREHALCQKFSESKKINKVFCIPGNAGTSTIATNLEANLLNFKSIKKIIVENKIDLVVVGPEMPLVNGIADYLKKKNQSIWSYKICI